jgi:hypothetical protein
VKVACAQKRDVIDAVQERNDGRITNTVGWRKLESRLELRRLRRHPENIDLPVECRGGSNIHLKVAKDNTLDAQAGRESRERLPPEKKQNIRTRAGKRAAHETADATGSKNRVTTGALPVADHPEALDGCQAGYLWFYCVMIEDKSERSGRRGVMADDQEWQRIATHFQEAFVRANPDSPTAVQSTFVKSLEQILRDTLDGASIEFVELQGGRRFGTDEFVSALILAGALLYMLRFANDEVHVVFIGAPVGGVYRETVDLAEGQVVRTRVTYEHPRLAEVNAAVAFIFTSGDAQRYVAIRKRLRLWGRRGIRVWGART